MPICMTARYRVRPHFVDECKRVIQQLVEHVKVNEPGTTLYLAKQDILDPTSFQHLLIFEDEAALAIHQQSPASARFVQAVYPEAIKPLEFNEFNLFAAKLPNA